MVVAAYPPQGPRNEGSNSKRTAARVATAVLGWLVMLAAILIAGANFGLAALEGEREFTSISSVPARSVAIVPGARVIDGRPLSILRGRLEAALGLYLQRRVQLILVSGRDSAAAPEVSVMRDWLSRHGVPSTDILADDGGLRTRETMNRAASLYRVRDAIICTQSVNMARSLLLARAAGIDAIGLSVSSDLSRSTRYQAVEALKTALAIVESAVRTSPQLIATPDRSLGPVARR